MQAGITEKLDNAGHGISAEFTLDETLAIIGEGGGNKALASLLAENAANKAMLTVRSRPAIPEQLERLISIKVKEAAAPIVERQKRMEADIKALRQAVEGQKMLDDPEDKQLREIKRFMVENLNVTGRSHDYVFLSNLYRFYGKVTHDYTMSMDALLYAVGKISMNGIRVVRKGAYRGLRGCLLKDDLY
jgi:hypothetical protein